MLPEEVLREILTWLSRYEWDTVEIVNRGFSGAIRAATTIPSTMHYRFIDEVYCTGQDLVLTASGESVKYGTSNGIRMRLCRGPFRVCPFLQHNGCKLRKLG